jgi:hypothetical protein
MRLPGCDDLEAATFGNGKALEVAEKDGEFDGAWIGNFNWAPRLASSQVWQRVMTKVIQQRPQQVLRMAIGRVPSGMSIYLESPENYSFVAPQRAVHPTLVVTGLLSVFAAPVALFLIGVFWLWVWRKRPARSRPLPELGLLSFVLVYQMAVSLLEYGENNRFQVEAIPLMLVIGFSVVSYATATTNGLVHAEE